MGKLYYNILTMATLLFSMPSFAAENRALHWCAYGPSDGFVVNRKRGDGDWKFYAKVRRPTMDGESERRYRPRDWTRRDRYRVAEYNGEGRSNYSNVLNLGKMPRPIGGCNK